MNFKMDWRHAFGGALLVILTMFAYWLKGLDAKIGTAENPDSLTGIVVQMRIDQASMQTEIKNLTKAVEDVLSKRRR